MVLLLVWATMSLMGFYLMLRKILLKNIGKLTVHCLLEFVVVRSRIQSLVGCFNIFQSYEVSPVLTTLNL